MKTIAYGFSLFCVMSLIFGTTLMIGGDHIGDFIIVLSAIGAITSMQLLERFSK